MQLKPFVPLLGTEIERNEGLVAFSHGGFEGKGFVLHILVPRRLLRCTPPFPRTLASYPKKKDNMPRHGSCRVRPPRFAMLRLHSPLLSFVFVLLAKVVGGLFSSLFHPFIAVQHIKGKWVVSPTSCPLPRFPHSLWTRSSLDHSGAPCSARAALPVASAVPANHQVLGLIATHVKVEVVLRHQVHVVEYEAVPVFLLESLQIAHIQELGAIKLLTSSLLRVERKMKALQR